VPLPAVQAELRRQFARWGLPRRVRVDNGHPWGTSSDLPPRLALWLIGLGVDMDWNDPRQPQQNGKVERSMGTGKRWAEPQRCPTVTALQTQVDEADWIQRECYPVVGGLSRLAAFPELHHSGRRYTRAGEHRSWSLQRVLTFLAEYVVARKVWEPGQISVYEQPYYVGKPWIGQTVYVHLDPISAEWVITDAEDRQLRRYPAREISKALLVNLISKKDQ